MRWLMPAPPGGGDPCSRRARVPVLDDYREMLMRGSMSVSPERAVARGQIRQIVDDAINQLPAPFRTVFVLRQIEDLDVGEVAERLGIPAATVKTRHLRARRRLQRLLGPGLSGALSGNFPFDRSVVRAAGDAHLPLPRAGSGAQGSRHERIWRSHVARADRTALSKGRSSCAGPRPDARSTINVREAVAQTICACVLGIEDDIERHLSGTHAGILDEVTRRGGAAARGPVGAGTGQSGR